MVFIRIDSADFVISSGDGSFKSVWQVNIAGVTYVLDLSSTVNPKVFYTHLYFEIGSGIAAVGVSDQTRSVREIFTISGTPAVIEADSINCVRNNSNNLLGIYIYDGTTQSVSEDNVDAGSLFRVQLGQTADSSTIANDPTCCVHPDSEVITKNGVKAIKDVRKGDFVKAGNGEFIKVLHNIRFNGVNEKLIRIEEGALGNNVPNKVLKIRHNHPIFHNGKSVKPFALRNGKTIKFMTQQRYCPLHTLITEEKRFVLTNGVKVVTWSNDKWNKFMKRNVSNEFRRRFRFSTF